MMDAKERLANQRENQNFFSEKISELSRYIGFALAALGFAFVSDKAELYASLEPNWQNAMLFATLLGCIVVLLDYLQYACGWFAASSAASNELNDYKLGRIGKSFRFFQTFFFYAKQAIAVLGALLLIASVGSLLG